MNHYVKTRVCAAVPFKYTILDQCPIKKCLKKRDLALKLSEQFVLQSKNYSPIPKMKLSMITPYLSFYAQSSTVAFLS